MVQFVLSARPLEIVTEDGACINRLEATITDTVSRATLKLELAVVVIVARPLVQGTYTMEGDSVTTLIGYDLIQQVNTWFVIHTPGLTFPGLEEAMADCAVSLNLSLVTIRARVLTMITGVHEYFVSRILGMLAEDVEILRVCRLANPMAYKRISPTVQSFRSDVEHLKHFTKAEIDGIVSELTLYTARVNAHNFDDDGTFANEMRQSVLFWKDNLGAFEFLPLFVQYCYTLTTSSAAAERTFSILLRHFNDQQESSLEDYIQASVMAEYNSRPSNN